MKRSVVIPVVLSLLAVSASSVAVAAPRGAASKIMGNFTQFYVPSRSSQPMVYQNVMPQTFEQPQAATAQKAQNPSTRRFSYEPSKPVVKQPTKRQPATTMQAPTTRRYSYEPETWITTPDYQQRNTPRRSNFSPVRDAASKILDEY